jgi:hypothetical protein
MKKIDPKAIQRKNRAFWKKSKAEQAVAVAKDVLLQLEYKKYKARTGTYISANALNLPNAYDGDLQDLMLTKNPRCTVCAVGSAFLSMARLGDELTIGDDYHDSLALIFGIRQVSLMEAAFEGWRRNDGSLSATKASRLFYEKYPKDQDRLRAIFQNVIDNGGKFIP